MQLGMEILSDPSFVVLLRIGKISPLLCSSFLRVTLTRLISNGHTNGITLPSAAGQEAVIRKAYAVAGLPTTETDYIEVCRENHRHSFGIVLKMINMSTLGPRDGNPCR